MSGFEIKFRALRNNPGWIYCFVAVIVMLLEVLNVDCFCDSRLLKQITGVFEEFRVVPDPAKVCFEMCIVDSIKTD